MTFPPHGLSGKNYDSMYHTKISALLLHFGYLLNVIYSVNPKLQLYVSLTFLSWTHRWWHSNQSFRYTHVLLPGTAMCVLQYIHTSLRELFYHFCLSSNPASPLLLMLIIIDCFKPIFFSDRIGINKITHVKHPDLRLTLWSNNFYQFLFLLLCVNTYHFPSCVTVWHLN